MKKFTKLLSLLLAVLMAASLATAAFADGHPSVVRVQISGVALTFFLCKLRLWFQNIVEHISSLLLCR